MPKPMAFKSPLPQKGFLWLFSAKKGLAMAEKGLVSRIDVGLMDASDSKLFAEKPMKNFGDENRDEKGFVCLEEGEG